MTQIGSGNLEAPKNSVTTRRSESANMYFVFSGDRQREGVKRVEENKEKDFGADAAAVDESMATSADTVAPHVDEIAFIRKLADEKRGHLLARMESVNVWRDATEESHREAHKMAERMAGRKLQYLNASEREKAAARDERIGNQYAEEIAVLEQIERILLSQPVWRDISTAPKDHGEDLIICDGNDLVGHGFFNRAEHRWDWLDGDPIRDARWWMPLPAPPVIETGNPASSEVLGSVPSAAQKNTHTNGGGDV